MYLSENLLRLVTMAPVPDDHVLRIQDQMFEQ